MQSGCSIVFTPWTCFRKNSRVMRHSEQVPDHLKRGNIRDNADLIESWGI